MTTTAPTIEVAVQDGKLVITLPLETPKPSASGKTLVVASTHGNVPTTAVLDGRPITVGVNAYVRK